MCKILILFFTTILLVSCNSDMTDNLLGDKKTYKVSFNISTTTPKADNSKPGFPRGNVSKYIIYKNSGEYLCSSYVGDTQSVSVELPAGEYKIAVLSFKDLSYGDPVPNPVNYNTDYCMGNRYIQSAVNNELIYFETTDFTVGENLADIESSIVLKPMWSEVKVNVNDASSCVLPVGATEVFCVADATYYGFAIRDKVSTKSYDPRGYFTTNSGMSIQDFRQGGVLQTVMAQSKDVTIRLVFGHRSPDVAGFIIDWEGVIYKGDFESGKQVLLTGDIAEKVVSGEQLISFSIAVKDLEGINQE